MVDWSNKEQVIAHAKALGRNLTVFKHPDQDNFNITHTARKDRYEDEWVVHQT